MYDHALHYGRKHFCRYCLQAFSIEEILKCHIKDCFKVNDEQRIKLKELSLKELNMLKSKILKKK